MSEKGEKTCPLCTEEMDLTDQQLKPCKCGYEICVWCWHHVMEMEERDGTEGRCPACRTPYDKEKIVGTAANCKRMVAEINSERRQKSQKAKPKASEGRMHLSNVRVIQRNLVYVIGLPLNLADEDLLQQREYFGQYGKVLKVSISRTATGVIQHASNNSCCVYITYAKEEEAIRCIQSVHSFILEGRPLRACYGTTKYCHAWLRSMPCSIPNCLYLHEFGSQEDSFTKDEIVSAFTRFHTRKVEFRFYIQFGLRFLKGTESRVQQIVGATNNMLRRSGDVLPPPADEYINSNISLTTKPIANNASNNIENQNKGYCSDGGAGKFNALPPAVSWVMRVSASLPPNKNLSGAGQPPCDQPRTCTGPQVLESEAVSTTRSIWNIKLMEANTSSEVHLNSKFEPLEMAKEYINGDCQIALSNANAETILNTVPANITSKNQTPSLPSSEGCAPISPECIRSLSSPDSGKDDNYHIIGGSLGICSGLSSISLQSNNKKENSDPVVVNRSVSNHASVNMVESHGSQEDTSEQFSEPTTSPASREASTMEDFLDFDDQQLKALEGIHHFPSISSPCSLLDLNLSSGLSWKPAGVSNHSNLDAQTRIVPIKHEVARSLTSKNSICNGFYNKKVSSLDNLDATIDHTSVLSEIRLGNYMGKSDNTANPLHSTVASDIGESSIISKILSIDSDAWEGSLTSPQSLFKLLSENDEQHGSLKIPSLLKESENRQSRFSFARQDDFSNHVSHSANKCHASNDFMKNKDFCMDEYQNIVSSSDSMESVKFPSRNSLMSPSVSRAPSSAPPGFGVPSRALPPGFSGTTHRPFDSSVTSSHMLQTSAPAAAKNGGRYGDVAFVDPAILEVGKGINKAGLNNLGSDMRQTLSPQQNPFDHDAQLQLRMQQSLSEYQNLGCPDHGTNRFSPSVDSFVTSSMLYDQSQPNHRSALVQSTAQQFKNAHMSSGHLGSLNEVKSASDLGVDFMTTNGGLGFNKFVPDYEDLKFQISNSRNLYKRGFAM